MTIVDTTLVERAVARALGVDVKSATLIPTEGDSVVCDVDVGSTSVIFKAEYDAQLKVSRWYAARFAERGIPTPAMLVLDDSEEIFPSAFGIFERAAGTTMGRISLESTPPASLSSQLGSLLRRIHEIEADGVGWIRVSGDGVARGANDSWSEMVASQASWGLTHAIKHGLLGSSVAERIWAAVRAAGPMLERARPWRLLHGDIRPDHVFCVDGRVTSIIDMQGRIGDPVYDFAHYAVQVGPGGLDRLLAGYEPDDELLAGMAERFPLYEIIEMTGILRWFHEHPSEATAPIVEELRARIPLRVAALSGA